MNVTLIVAASTNDVIGRNGALPWHLPEDLRLFRELSLGKAVIMGRRTHEAIGRPLPGRRNIVISRQPDLQLDGCEVVGSPEAALALVEGDDEVMVIGGELVYRQFLPRANRLHLTRVHVTVEGDTFLPSLDTAEWRVAEEQDYPANDTRPLGFTFITFERIAATQD
jgi:dihydrofolate reductase